MAGCTRVSDPGIPCKEKKVSPSMINIVPALEGCFTSSMNRTFFFTLSFLFSLVNTDKTASSSSNAFFCFLKIFIIAVLPLPTVLTHMFFSAAVVAYQIEFTLFIVIFFCFLTFFFFFIFIFRTFLILRFVAVLTTFSSSLLVLYIVCT